MKSRAPQVLLLTALTLSASPACMTPEELAALNSALEIGTSIGGTPGTGGPIEPACRSERYTQPEAQISRSIDLLFVMDTSGSMSDNRAKVADGISAFVSELPADADYRIGVMLAHGSRSSWSGKLFSYNGTQIFNSQTTPLSTIQSQLKSMVLNAPFDLGGEQGEQGSFSLLRGISTNLSLNRQAGFFRTDAALAIVFVSDENDICAPYVGLPTLPGMTSTEKYLRSRDCPAGITTDQVISEVKNLQGSRPYLFGGVVHKTFGYHDTAGDDGYGYGYMEVISAAQGISTEINDGDYTEGLSNMGKLATIKLNLILDYTLTSTNVDPSTIEAYVDGARVAFTYDAAQNEVHLSSGGTARSVVDIEYCEKEPAPSPSPSPSPSPTPTLPPVWVRSTTHDLSWIC